MGANPSHRWQRNVRRFHRHRYETIDRALTGESVPELHTALNSLAVDITALDEVFALYGLRVKPLKAEPANDLATISRLSNLAGQFAEALSDVTATTARPASSPTPSVR
ncbi:hypothetical protein [Novosphingobium sp. ST904]|uniref:hypothetical protein n=1 Tax=Novosphingobium sp. ST904 TaxID=1684385 RepID=UPI0006C83247|nr:hypothetical protein [Novosphingobium sp. ST904]KPH66027.1 hypothetical protein ADT71_08660 [Novosphingobium sp. ST904]